MVSPNFDVFILETSSQQIKSELDQYLAESRLPRCAGPLTIRYFDMEIKEMVSYRSSLRPATVESNNMYRDWIQSDFAEVSDALWSLFLDMFFNILIGCLETGNSPVKVSHEGQQLLEVSAVMKILQGTRTNANRCFNKRRKARIVRLSGGWPKSGGPKVPGWMLISGSEFVYVGTKAFCDVCIAYYPDEVH
ncbi:hypothetical protein SDJN03_00600, partial [Cucurbita argyrosperma subsp. sororia]